MRYKLVVAGKCEVLFHEDPRWPITHLDFVYVFRMAGFKRAPIVLNWAIALILLIKVHWITLKDEFNLAATIILWSRMRGNRNFFQNVVV